MDSAVTSMNQVLTSLTHLQSNSPQLETSFSHLLLALRDLIMEAERQIQLSTSAILIIQQVLMYVQLREQSSKEKRVHHHNYDIPCQQLQFIYNSGFAATCIAGLLHVSLSTVRRCLRLILCALHE